MLHFGYDIVLFMYEDFMRETLIAMCAVLVEKHAVLLLFRDILFVGSQKIIAEWITYLRQ